MVDQARDLGPEVLEQLRDIVAEHDPDVVAIAVITGSPARDVAVSVWTGFEGPDAEERGVQMLVDCLTAEEIERR